MLELGRRVGKTLLLTGLALAPTASFAGTGQLLSQWMSRAPAIDGSLGGTEWSETTPIDLGSGVSVRFGNDARTLYIAVYDANDPTLDGFQDLVYFSFDDEGGTAPRLDDGAWGSSAGCQKTAGLGEGGLFIRDFSGITYSEWWQNGYCDQLTLTDRAQFAVAAQDGLTYEIAIPLDGPMPLRAQAGERFGIWLRVQRNASLVACLPAACGGVYPSDYRNLVLASGGCNTGAQGFGSGLPQIGLPLDWETNTSSGTGWQQSTVFADPVFCQENVTGGAGAAACVSEVSYSGGESYSILGVPVSVAGQTTARMRLRALLEPGVGGAELRLGAWLHDGATSFPVVWYDAHASETLEIDLPMSPGNLPTELAFWHLTESGGEEGGFAEVDDVELLCGPVLFADGFDSGLTTHWSSTTP